MNMVQQREKVELFRLSERLCFRYRRFKPWPWQHGFDGSKCIATNGTRLNERLAYPGVKPYLLAREAREDAAALG